VELSEKLALTLSEVADLLGVSRRGIYNLISREGLPSVKLGGRRLVRRADLERWLAEKPVAGQEASEQTPQAAAADQ
jgi:excisionase family DNA binding protein